MGNLDNIPRLDAMMADMEQADPLYKPTNYWGNYLTSIYNELKYTGLDNFRSRHGTLLDAFGASNYNPCFFNLLHNRRLNNHITQKIPGYIPLLHSAHRFINNTVMQKLMRVKNQYSLSLQDLRQSAVEHAQYYGLERGARPLLDIEASDVGNPEDYFSIRGRHYTWYFLYYYYTYAFTSEFVDFEKTKTIVELGPGMGSQTEILAKLYPHLSFYLFDIPPMLYLCEQYLSSVFGNRVVSYDITRHWEKLEPLEPGQIAILPSWKFPLLQTQKKYLFWNAASFQEMEPSVVANYLSFVNKGADSVFLMAMMSGQTQANKSGGHGVLERTTFEHYANGLSRFDLVSRAKTRAALATYPAYDNTIWQRK